MLNLEEEVKIKLSDVCKFLKNVNLNFDIIFADPPYYKYKFEDLKKLVKPILSDAGIFCYESNKCEIENTLNLQIKKYGNTQLIFWRKI